jgi:hypothetical protein
MGRYRKAERNGGISGMSHSKLFSLKENITGLPFMDLKL